MPHYDESFFNDDNQNQRRNKRSYRVYKNGISPLNILETGDVLQALEERGTSVIKRNIRNIKHRGNRYKPDSSPSHVQTAKYKTQDVLGIRTPRISVFDPKKFYDIRNNNIPPLSSCKSFDNLTLKKSRNGNVNRERIRNGTSLQNLVCDENLKYFSSPSEECVVSSHKDDVGNSYSVVEARRRPLRRMSRTSAAPGVGIYRHIGDRCADKKNIKEAAEEIVYCACGFSTIRPTDIV
ncbi:hypothetical protein RR48_04648 [Papilio machaon]|uniref:Uncharacterized protein n=1 Tax=Papilio machaon TaxID=76193 RepID=A0A0N1PJ32_PAPMA|nr:hypothetical protein RR48_04648 [Papilio machaon]